MGNSYRVQAFRCLLLLQPRLRALVCLFLSVTPAWCARLQRLNSTQALPRPGVVVYICEVPRIPVSGFNPACIFFNFLLFSQVQSCFLVSISRGVAAGCDPFDPLAHGGQLPIASTYHSTLWGTLGWSLLVSFLVLCRCFFVVFVVVCADVLIFARELRQRPIERSKA